MTMQKVTTFLMFKGNTEEAMNFYAKQEIETKKQGNNMFLNINTILFNTK